MRTFVVLPSEKPSFHLGERPLKVAKDGIPLITLFAGIAVALSGLGVWLLGPAGWGIAGVGLALTAWCVWFFRDPDRSPPDDPRAVVSPADGVVVSVGRAEPPPELDLGGRGPFDRICVFMNVFNVHVNRVPADGVVERTAYHPGRFFNASLDKASVHNERMAVAMRTRSGFPLVFVQIAGLIARRIVCRLNPGQEVRAGERFGLIRFGSRVDVYVPAGSEIAASLGQKTVAGQTVLARLPAAALQAPAPATPEVTVGR